MFWFALTFGVIFFISLVTIFTLWGQRNEARRKLKWAENDLRVAVQRRNDIIKGVKTFPTFDSFMESWKKRTGPLGKGWIETYSEHYKYPDLVSATIVVRRHGEDIHDVTVQEEFSVKSLMDNSPHDNANRRMNERWPS